MQIDWLEGSFTGRPSLEVLHDLIQAFGEVCEVEHGGLGYEHMGMFPFMARVYWSQAHPAMGVHLSFPAESIGIFGDDVRGLMVRLERMGFKCTRLDLAFDDRRGALDMGIIGRAVKSGAFVARSRKQQHMESSDGHGNWGETWGFGSRKSESFIRIYDKAVEQQIWAEHWIRVELELKGERSDQGFRFLVFNTAVGDWSEQAASWLLGVLDFKDVGEDSNKSRWESSAWWTGFLEVCRKSRLSIPRSVRTVEQLKKWVAKQVGPSLFVLAMTVGWEAILGIIGDSSERIRAKHRVMLAEFAG